MSLVSIRRTDGASPVFCYCCHRWGELLFEESPVWQVLPAGGWGEESSLDVRSLQSLSRSPMISDTDGHSASVPRAKLAKEDGVMNHLCFSLTPLVLHHSPGRFTEGERLFQWWQLLPWLHSPPAGQGVWHQSCSFHPSRAQWHPAGSCSSKGSLVLPLLFLHCGIHQRDSAAVPWVFPNIDT